MKEKPQLKTIDASVLSQVSGGGNPPIPWKQLGLQPQPYVTGQPQPMDQQQPQPY